METEIKADFDVTLPLKDAEGRHIRIKLSGTQAGSIRYKLDTIMEAEHFKKFTSTIMSILSKQLGCRIAPAAGEEQYVGMLRLLDALRTEHAYESVAHTIVSLIHEYYKINYSL